MLSLTTSKILAMVLTGVVPFFLGLIPKWADKVGLNSDNLRHKVIISCLLCFGGGVLLATSQVHMQTEVSKAGLGPNVLMSIPCSSNLEQDELRSVHPGFFLVHTEKNSSGTKTKEIINSRKKAQTQAKKFSGILEK